MQLLQRDTVWVCNYPQEKQFKRLKELVTHAPILLYDDLTRTIVVSTDENSYGLRAALVQEIDGNLMIFVSCTPNSTERKYVQIEKEYLSCVRAWEKSDKYITGLESFKLLTDHKPLTL